MLEKGCIFSEQEIEARPAAEMDKKLKKYLSLYPNQ